jgi:hypothetical protein
MVLNDKLDGKWQVLLETEFHKRISFDKKRSKKISTLTILVLIFLTFNTAIHDPFYRCLTDDSDGDQRRLWCTVTYSPVIPAFNLVVNIFHLLTPFFINLISAIIIITQSCFYCSNYIGHSCLFTFDYFIYF